jgi:hypothetical protein
MKCVNILVFNQFVSHLYSFWKVWRKIKGLIGRRLPPAGTILIIGKDVFVFPVEVVTQPNVAYISIYSLMYETRYVLNQTENGEETDE